MVALAEGIETLAQLEEVAALWLFGARVISAEPMRALVSAAAVKGEHEPLHA